MCFVLPHVYFILSQNISVTKLTGVISRVTVHFNYLYLQNEIL